MKPNVYRWLRWGGIWEIVQLNKHYDSEPSRWYFPGSLSWVFEDNENIEEWGDYITCPYLGEGGSS